MIDPEIAHAERQASKPLENLQQRMGLLPIGVNDETPQTEA